MRTKTNSKKIRNNKTKSILSKRGSPAAKGSKPEGLDPPGGGGASGLRSAGGKRENVSFGGTN